jgi:hypothetical protein
MIRTVYYYSDKNKKINGKQGTIIKEIYFEIGSNSCDSRCEFHYEEETAYWRE